MCCAVLVLASYIGTVVFFFVHLSQPHGQVRPALDERTRSSSSLEGASPAPTAPVLCEETASVVDLVHDLRRRLALAETRVKTLVHKRQSEQVALLRAAGDMRPVPESASLSAEPHYDDGAGSAEVRARFAGCAGLHLLTYNLWNINDRWALRRTAIAELVRTAAPHLVAVQESRVSPASGLHQIVELARDLADAGFDVSPVFAPVLRDLPANQGSEEAVGLLSRLPVLSHTVIQLMPSDGNAAQARALLHVVIDVSSVLGAATPQADVFVAHFPVYDAEQCHSALALWRAVQGLPARPHILLGDFNVYFDFEHPLGLLTRPLPPEALWPADPCGAAWAALSIAERARQRAGPHFTDAFDSIHGTHVRRASPGGEARWWGGPAPVLGTTFSNFDDYRLADPSRPDRILWRDTSGHGRLATCAAAIAGARQLEPAGRDGPALYASDHCAVLAAIAPS